MKKPPLVRLFVPVLACIVALLVAASPAFAGYRYYGGGNWYGDLPFVSSNAWAPLTGDEADNGTCEGQGYGCGEYLCTAAYGDNGNWYQWGPAECYWDQSYHPFGWAPGWLIGAYWGYYGQGQYVYGTIFW